MQWAPVPAQSGIYAITNTVNGKQYIGQSYNVRVRWNEHKCELRHNRHHNTILQRAWNKYTETAFRFDVLTLLPVSELDAAEQRYCELLKPAYNVRVDPVTNRGHIVTAETRAKQSAKAKGRRHSQAQNDKMSTIMKDRVFSAEHRANLVISQHERPPMTPEEKAAFVARMNTPEIRAKRVAAQTGLTRTPEQCAHISAARLRWAPPPGLGEKTRAFHTGRKRSDETRARQRAAWVVRNARRHSHGDMDTLWDGLGG